MRALPTLHALDTLQLSPGDMRTLGYRVVDLLVEHVTSLPDAPVARPADPAALAKRLREPPPTAGAAPDVVLERAAREVLATGLHVSHPRFFAYVPSPGNFVGAMADALAAGYNVFAGSGQGAPGATEVESVTIDWLRQLCGLPAGAGGLFVSGGSVANLTALAVARQVRLGGRTEEGVAYCSDQTHASVVRDWRILGFAPGALRILPSDEAFRLPLGALRRAVAADRAAGKTPFCVIANAGTTNTGAIDPLPALADFCRDEGLWLHADGAYGAAAVLSEQGAALLAGLERVDSLALDPHKWLCQPLETGCVLVRDRRHLRQTFEMHPEYLRDAQRAEEVVNYSEYGIQLTRGFRALKLWMSLQVFGLDAFRAAVGRGLALARLAEQTVRELPDWEVVTPAVLSVVTFRYAPAGRMPGELNALQGQIVDALVADGYAMLSTTELRGRVVLRMCAINPRTTEADVLGTIARLDELARWCDGSRSG